MQVSMDAITLRPTGVATDTVQEGRIIASSTSGSAQDASLAAGDLTVINNAPRVCRPQGRDRAHTLPHDYGLRINSGPGCERRRRRQRLAQQYNVHVSQKPLEEMAASQDVTEINIDLPTSDTFPPLTCHKSFHTRRRMHSLDGGLATAGDDLFGSVMNGANIEGHIHVHAEDDTHQISAGGGMSRSRRWKRQSFISQKLALFTAVVMVACFVVSTVMTSGSQHRSYHRKTAAVSSSHPLAMNERGQTSTNRSDPEVRFLPGMRMEIIAKSKEVDTTDEGGDRPSTLATPSNEEEKRPGSPQRVAQVDGNGRKKRRPRLAHARASFDPIPPSQGAADKASRGSGLRSAVKEKTSRRKLPTFVLPPEEIEGNARDLMRNFKSAEVGNVMSWSKVFLLVTMIVLCVQLLASLRRG